MKEIVKVDPVSVAKVISLIIGGVYLAVGVIINLVVLIFGLGNLTGLDYLGFGSGLVATILVSIIVGLVTFIIGILGALIYNFVANFFGGVIVLFEDRTVVEERLRESRAAKLALKEEKKRLKEERARQKQDQKNKKEKEKLLSKQKDLKEPIDSQEDKEY